MPSPDENFREISKLRQEVSQLIASLSDRSNRPILDVQNLLPEEPILNYSRRTAITFFKVDMADGAITVDLPDATGIGTKILIFKKIDSTANTLTLNQNVGDLIDGATSLSISTQYQSKWLASDGTDWHILADL